jgi:hypothetical protein
MVTVEGGNDVGLETGVRKLTAFPSSEAHSSSVSS